MTKVQSFPRSDPNEPQDPRIYTLQAIVTLLSTTGVKVKDVGLIEGVRQHYILLLDRYLRWLFGARGVAKLGQGLLLPTVANEVYDIHKCMLPV